MDKRGTWAFADILYWFFYIPMTAATIIALVLIPQRLLATAVRPMPLDAAIFEERVIQNLAKYSPATGASNELTPNINMSLSFSLSQKKWGYKIKIGQQSFYGNKQFYEIAVPIAPNFDRFITNRTIGNTNVTIDQVYPKRYEKFAQK